MTSDYTIPDDGELWVTEEPESSRRPEYTATLIFNNGQTTQFKLASLSQGHAIKNYLFKYKRHSMGERFYGISGTYGSVSFESMIDFELLQMILIEPNEVV